MLLKTIALVNSPFIDKFGTPRQSLIAKHTLSTLDFDKKKIPGEMLEGLQVGTYIWVLFGFHLNQQKKTIVKVHPPRLRGKKMGVLATRSPHRPNPLGLSLAKVEAIEKNKIQVSGLDLVHQTPVYDIKPYLPKFDKPREKQILWVGDHPFPTLKVLFAKNALLPVPVKERVLFKKQLKEILREDPRPLAYLEKKSYRYWLSYNTWDIGFDVDGETLTVRSLKKISK